MRKANSALSMLELLMTMVVFSFGILPLIVLFQDSHKQTAQAKNLMIAHSLGRTIIADVRALGFDLLDREINTPTRNIEHTSIPVEGPVVPDDDESIIYPEYYKRFHTTLRLERASAGDENNKIRVELDIEWDEPGRTFNLGFGTVVVKYGK